MALVALLLRAAYLAAFRESPFFAAPVLDSAFHRELAREVSEKGITAGAPWFRPPLYPWVVGGIEALLGASPWTGRAVSATAGVLTAVGTWACAARLGFGSVGRLAAGSIPALFAPALFLEGELLGEPLATALGVWGLFAILRGRGDPSGAPSPGRARHWFTASTLWSLSALARGSQAILPPLLFLVGIRGAGRGARLAAVAAGVALVWTGPALIMASHGAGFRFPATQAGINLYVGNHPGADGRSVDVPELAGASGWKEFAGASVRAASRETGRALGPAEASDHWTRRALAFWREHPADALGLTAARALYLVHGFEGPNNRSLYEVRREVPWFPLLLWKVPGAYWPSGLLIPLALVGVIETARRRRWRPVLLYAAGSLLPLLLFFVCARFRLPALPALALLAVAGATALKARPRTRVPAAVAFLLVANAPWGPAVAESPLGEALVRGEAALNAGAADTAEEAYRAALALDPGEPRAWLGLAVLAENRGDLDEALAALDRAREGAPGYWALEEVQARVMQRLGRHAEAAEALARARSDFPENPRLTGRLGLALEILGRDAEARTLLEDAAGMGVDDPEVWNSLGRYRRLAGDRAGALGAWDRAVHLDPRAFKPRFNRGLARFEGGDRAGGTADLRLALGLAPDAEAAARVREVMTRLGDAAP